MTFSKRQRDINDDFKFLLHNQKDFEPDKFNSLLSSFTDLSKTKTISQTFEDFNQLTEQLQAKRSFLLSKLQLQFDDLSMSYQSFLSGGEVFSLSPKTIKSFKETLDELESIPPISNLLQQGHYLKNILENSKTVLDENELEILSSKVKSDIDIAVSEVEKYSKNLESKNFEKSSPKNYTESSTKFLQTKFDEKTTKNKAEIAKLEREIKDIKQKDDKPFRRRFLRTITGGRFPKKISTKEQQDKLNNLNHINSKIAKQSEGIKSDVNLEESRSLSNVTKKTQEFYETIDADKNLQNVFDKQEKVLEQKTKIKEDTSQLLKKKAAEAFSIAVLISQGKILPKEGKSSKVFGALETIAEFASIPVLGQVVGASRLIFDFVKSKRMEKANEKITEFHSQEQQQEVINGFINKLVDSYLEADKSILSKLDEKSLDLLSKEIIGKMIKGIASGKIKIEENGNIEDLIKNTVDYVRNGKVSVLDKKLGPKEAIKVAGGRDGVKYTAQGSLERMAVKITNNDGKEIVLIPQERQIKDEKYGEPKYGTRQPSERELEEFSKNGKLKGFEEFKPLEKKLEEKLSIMVNALKSENKAEILKSTMEIVEKNSKDLGAVKSDIIKADLSKIIDKGKRSSILGNADEDRVVFNNIKSIVEKLIENRKFKIQEKERSGKNQQNLLTRTNNITEPTR